MGGCQVPKGAENYNVRGTAWKPMIWTALASTALTTGISLALIILHLRRYRAPKEQRQIVRIVFSVVVYSFVALFEIYKYEIAQYIDPIGDVYEAFGLCALFLLFIQYAAPTGTFNDDTLAAVKLAEETETNFNWVKIGWIFVFQYPVVEILCVAIQEATEATNTYCLDSLSPKYAHIWLEIIESVSIGACVFTILQFRGRFKNLMKVRRGLAKLLCFKGIVFIRFAQQWVFSFLLSEHVIKVSNTLSYNDILYGIPGVLTCVEMVLFAAGFWYAFSSTEYGSKVHRETPLPIWKAALNALNPWDIIVGMVKIPTLCIEMSRSGDWAKWRAVMRERGLQGAIRKGIRKYKNRGGKGQAQGDGRYQEINEGRESYSRPMEMEPGASQSYRENGYYDMSGGLGGTQIYQPPAGSPPDEARTGLMTEPKPSGEYHYPSDPPPSYLGTETAFQGRPRASSGSALMVESQGEYGRPRSPSAGQFGYDRSRSPSGRFVEAPTEGRDIV